MSTVETVEEASASVIRHHALPIGGEWISAKSFDVLRHPFDQSVTAEVGQADLEMVGLAVAAARKGADTLATWTNLQRGLLLDRMGALVARDRVELAARIAAETGKPVSEARIEVDRCLQTLAASAAAARDLHGEVVPMDAAAMGAGRMAMTVREPVGVIAIITPFNVPLNLAMHKLGPALAGGNAVIHKPSEQTPLSALHLASLIAEAGAPAGAYSVVTGPGETIGRALVESDGVNMVTFTGSVAAGKDIRARAGLKKVTLELGGNSAVILEADADMENAVLRVVQGGYGYAGQLCISVQRVYVHESIAADFEARLVTAVEALRVGDPGEETTQVASMISEEAAERVERAVAGAVQAGGKLLTGGTRKGSVMRPGVIAGVPDATPFMKSELFGPMVAVSRYRDLDDAIDRVNATPFGLQAGIYTNQLQRAFHAARRLKVGGVLINDVPAFRADHMPYGGTKESGMGREGPRYAIEEMTEPKLICWKV